MLQKSGTPADAGLAVGAARRDTLRKPGLGLIGVGAFGSFCIPHLKDHFEVHIADMRPDLQALADRYGVQAAGLTDAAAQDIVVLAVPWRSLDKVARDIAPFLKTGAVIVEVCSIKVRPLELLRAILPDRVSIVGTHPMFGPQSGRDGIAGLNVAVCPVPGQRAAARRVGRFLQSVPGLNVVEVGAEAHDRQMARVQGLTHFIARTMMALEQDEEAPLPGLSTSTWDHLMRMVDTVRHDSEALVGTITGDNPFAKEARDRFLREAAAFGQADPPAR